MAALGFFSPPRTMQRRISCWGPDTFASSKPLGRSGRSARVRVTALKEPDTAGKCARSHSREALAQPDSWRWESRAGVTRATQVPCRHRFLRLKCLFLPSCLSLIDPYSSLGLGWGLGARLIGRCILLPQQSLLFIAAALPDISIPNPSPISGPGSAPDFRLKFPFPPAILHKAPSSLWHLRPIQNMPRTSVIYHFPFLLPCFFSSVFSFSKVSIIMYCVYKILRMVPVANCHYVEKAKRGEFQCNPDIWG